MSARWTLCAELVLCTPAHFGSGGGDVLDMELLWDSVGNMPLIPGTSLGGALRSYLADWLGGYGKPEPLCVAQLFGGTPGDRYADQSAVIIFDALGAENTKSQIRDGVSIESAAGIAEDKALFNMEVVPKGTVFNLRFDLIVPNPESELGLLNALDAALSGLAPYEIAIGARRSRGFGRIQARDWRAQRYDLSTADGWVAWMDSPHENPLQESAPHETVRAALDTVLAAQGLETMPPHLDDARDRLVVNLQFPLKHGILIRSAFEADEEDEEENEEQNEQENKKLIEPDEVHLQDGNESIVAGTSIAGALRNQARRIASVVRNGDKAAWVEKLFGPEKAAKKLRASPLRISEEVIPDAMPLRFTRIQLDRFTQGVVQGALLEEEVHYGGSFTLHLELRNPCDALAGFLLLLVKDIKDGLVPIGGTTGIGRGTIDIDNVETLTIVWAAKGICGPIDGATANHFIAAFANCDPEEEAAS